MSATTTSITIPIYAVRHVDQPLQFAFGSIPDGSPLAMAGGSLGIDFELSTTLTFNVDSAAITSAATAPPDRAVARPADHQPVRERDGLHRQLHRALRLHRREALDG